jgi:hypothetical protein
MLLDRHLLLLLGPHLLVGQHPPQHLELPPHLLYNLIYIL